jgi:two-component system sensor histidine kinase GlrK
MSVTILRPKSLSGLLTVSLALLVLPLLVAVAYGTVQLRELSKDSDRLVRQSVETTRLTQQLFRDLTSMERSAGLYAVLDDVGLAQPYQDSQSSLLATLASLEAQPAAEQVAPMINHLRRGSIAIEYDLTARDLSPSERVSRVQLGFSGLWELANALSAATSEITESRLRGLERRTAATQQWLLASLAALVPAGLLLAAIYGYFVLRPLRLIDRSIAELGQGALGRPIAIQGPSDLAALGRQLEWLRTRLLEVAEEKNRFLRHMSHELKTPLANIREGTDLLVDGAVGPLDANQREVADILRDNALKLQRLIENLLSYSAWQSDATQLQLAPFRLPSLVGTVLDAQRLAIAARDITLDIEMDDIEIVADRAKLKLVVDNLLSNALKFTPRGGTIFIRGRLEGETAVIDFGDTGPGIPEPDRERIFEAFYTGALPQAGPLKGTGIGLSVVQEFVQAHGGTIELGEGRFPGAHFRLRLPISSLRRSPDGRQHAA